MHLNIIWQISHLAGNSMLGQTNAQTPDANCRSGREVKKLHVLVIMDHDDQPYYGC